jgi:hypothetical protein
LARLQSRALREETAAAEAAASVVTIPSVGGITGNDDLATHA